MLAKAVCLHCKAGGGLYYERKKNLSYLCVCVCVHKYFPTFKQSSFCLTVVRENVKADITTQGHLGVKTRSLGK